MQICAHCGAKNIDNLKVCWQCRRPLQADPLGQVSEPIAPYRPRARGIRPTVGIAMLLLFAAGIGGWWFLRSPEAVELPSVFAGQREVFAEQAREQERLVAKEFDLSSGYAFYGKPGTTPLYRLAVFRGLHPPYTSTFLVGHFERSMEGSSFSESVRVSEQRIGRVRFVCSRVPEPDGMLGEAGVFASFRWCSWQTPEELGILVDFASRDDATTLRLTRRARISIA
jgi:hypothetical protein